MTELSKKPVRDQAEHNAYFPSAYSLAAYTSPVSDFAGYQNEPVATAKKYKVLLVGTDERYLQMKNGKYFSTGNHPIDTLLPLMHLHHAGFEIEVATLSGNQVKFELWALPKEDQAVMDFYHELLPKLEAPAKLADLLPQVEAKDSPYVAVFFPGGHGALLDLPESKEVKQVLQWAMANEKKIVTLCHGPAALLAAANENDETDFLFAGYEMTVFPDSLDEGANIDIGYLPGQLKWLLGERLEKLGVKVINQDVTGQVHKDRNVLTGDSPAAANKLGILATQELLADLDN